MKTLIAFSTIALATVTSAAPITGPIQNPANNHYYFLLGADTWTASQAQSVVLGGNLATVNDAAENAWVVSTFLNYGGVRRDLWIGLTDAATEGIFKWVNGEPFTYSSWEPGQPDNGQGFYPVENYVHIFGGTSTEHLPGWNPGQWNDLQDVAGYYSNSGIYHEICGVVELVPEPSAGLILLAGVLLFQFRNQNRPAMNFCGIDPSQRS